MSIACVSEDGHYGSYTMMGKLTKIIQIALSNDPILFFFYSNWYIAKRESELA